MVWLALHHRATRCHETKVVNKLLSTGFGLGLLPKAPGTWGSLLPLFIVLGCGHFQVTPTITILTLVSLLLVFTVVTIASAKWYEQYFSKKDPPQVVCDEVAGQSIALLGMAWLTPPTESPYIWIGLAIIAFLLFRGFDIWKPGFIDKSQHLPAGWGVLMDDLLAGFFAGILVCIASTLLTFT